MPILLLIFIGPPACGKTTLAKNFETSSCLDLRFFRVTFDELIPQQLSKSWKDHRKEVQIHVENLIDRILLQNEPVPVVIIIDDNMYYRSMRFSYYQLARKKQIGFGQFFIESDYESCLKNNANRLLTEKVPDDVIINMFHKLEPPGEAFWERNSLIIKSSDPLNYLIDEIKGLLKCEVPKMIEVKNNEVINTNTIHLVDNILRKIVSESIKNCKLKDIREFAAQQARLKSIFFNLIREGFLDISHSLADDSSKFYTYIENHFVNFMNENRIIM